MGEAELAPEERTANAYPCPQCGADTMLKPGADALACSHCGHVVAIEDSAAPIHEHDFSTALARLRQAPASSLVAGAHEVMCKTCGARTVVTVQAGRCPFCDNAIV